ncbi:MAG: hypothetical protein ACIAQU_01955 [Phycisphaerales bacterium JB064]
MVGVGTLLLGAVSVGSSLLQWYTPVGFLVAQLVLSAGAYVGARAGALRFGWKLGGTGEAMPREPWSFAQYAMLFAIVLLMVLSLVERSLLPVHDIDGLMYHASRSAYWVQNHSVLPFETHNDRQTTFPFGAELVFAWPMLFTHGDYLGRLLHWAALPLATAGVYGVARMARASRGAGLFASLLYAATPVVLIYATTLKADIWAPLYVLGAGYWIVRSARHPQQAVVAFFWAGVMTALAMNVKVIVAAMIPVLALAPLLIVPWRRAVVAIVAAGVGGLVATMVSGLFVTVAFNSIHHGHPLGPEYMRKTVQPDFSARQVWTHTVRLPLFLIDLPKNPSPSLRQWMTKSGNDIVSMLDADELLPLENDQHWPGVFRFKAADVGKHFGLGGMLWLPMIGVGLVIVGVETRRTAPRLRLSPVALLTLLQVPLLLSVVYMIRWMGAGPDRFWMAAYALSLPTGVVVLSNWRWARVPLAVLALLGGAWATYPALRAQINRIELAACRPPDTYRFQAAIDLIPSGSTVLLVGTWNAQDYPLLAPRGRLENRVVLWGSHEFDPHRMSDALAGERVDYVLMERPNGLWQGWGAVDGTPMRRWLEARPDIARIDLGPDVKARLYRVERGG